MKSMNTRIVTLFVGAGLITSSSEAQTWAAASLGGGGYSFALASYNGYVYAGGSFTVGSLDYIAKWDGTSWSDVGGGLNARVYALVVFNGELYAGGNFTNAGGDANADYIAKWNGTSWSALGTGMNNIVSALGVHNNELYAGGNFTTAGGSAASHIAKWNGTTWSALGAGISDGVSAIVSYNSELYAGGSFLNAGSSGADNIARWDGSTWSVVGSATALNNDVYCLGVHNGELYVGGIFSDAGGNTSADYVARWNGSSWTNASGGTGGWTHTLYSYGGRMYAGGDFGGCIKRWDGSSWSTVAGGANTSVRALTLFGTDLYVGGGFSQVGSPAINTARVARWNDPTTILPVNLLYFKGQKKGDANTLYWATVSEKNNDYFTIESSPTPSEGGVFDWKPIGIVKGAGNSSTIHNYEFVDLLPSPAGEGTGVRYYRLKQTDYNGEFSYSKIITLNNTMQSQEIIFYPNPAQNNIFYFHNASADEDAIEIEITDAGGRKVYSHTTNQQGGILNVSELKNGIYFINTIINNQIINSQKQIINK